MRLEQKKRLHATHIYEMDNKRIKATRKTPFTSNSYEVKLSDLNSNISEQFSSGILWLIFGVLLFICGLCLVVIEISTSFSEAQGALIGLSIVPFAVSIIFFIQSYRKSFDLVILNTNENPPTFVLFYKNKPNQADFERYINELKNRIDKPTSSGFLS